MTQMKNNRGNRKIRNKDRSLPVARIKGTLPLKRGGSGDSRTFTEKTTVRKWTRTDIIVTVCTLAFYISVGILIIRFLRG